MSSEQDILDMQMYLRGLTAAGENGPAAPAFIKRLVHDYLVNNSDDLVEIGVGLDIRTYLAPWVGKVFDDETIPDIVRAIAEEFVAEGLRQTE